LAEIEEFIQTKIVQLKAHKEHLEPVEKVSDSITIAEMIAKEEALNFSTRKRKRTK
jgi:hypothetical protein